MAAEWTKQSRQTECFTTLGQKMPKSKAKLKWRVESKLQDWKVLLACISHHNSAGLSSPAAGVLCTPRGKTGQKMLAVWKPMSKSNTKVKRSELL